MMIQSVLVADEKNWKRYERTVWTGEQILT